MVDYTIKPKVIKCPSNHHDITGEKIILFTSKNWFLCKIIGFHKEATTKRGRSYWVAQKPDKEYIVIRRKDCRKRGWRFLDEIHKQPFNLNSRISKNLKQKKHQENNKCYVCGETMELKDCSFEHIIPLSEGGGPRGNNLTLSHVWCNNLRNARR